MLAARLHGPFDLRVEEIPRPGQPGPGEALLRVTAVGICGSDLHTYQDARIGDTVVETPLILGHEFAAVVEAVGVDSYDGNFAPLTVGDTCRRGPGPALRALRNVRARPPEPLSSPPFLRHLSGSRQPERVHDHAGALLLSRV